MKNSALWKALGLYGAGSWVSLQVIDVLAQNAGLPSWVFTLALILLIIGLPIVGTTAYIHGLRGGGDVPAEARKLFTWKNAVGGGVAALALWGILVTGWLFFGPGADRTATAAGAAASAAADASDVDLRSIAVLPFATRSEERQDEHFAEGMHDDVLTQLAKIDSLTVISRTSVMQFAGTTQSIPEIAAELGVATILEGGVQRAGDRIRVNVQLIEAATDKHLWAETYDEQMTAANVFAIQSDLAKKIAGALQATLTPETVARIEARPTESLEAYEAYSRGQYVYWGVRGLSDETLAEAQAFFEAAIAADSNYAAAWAGLADVYHVSGTNTSAPRDEMTAKAWEAVNHALELDPDLAEAHSRKGLLLWLDDGRAVEAEEAFLTAVELNPGSALTHARFGSFLINRERYEEAVQQVQRAVQLDPLTVRWRAALADAQFYAGDYEDSRAAAWQVVEMEPEAAVGYYSAAYAHGMLGQNDEALSAFKQAYEIDPTNTNFTFGLAWGWALVGERDSALAVLETEPAEGSNLKEYAIVHATLGDLDTAFEYVDQLVEESPGDMRLFPADPTADPLKSDPRYQAALERAGIE